jgi:hypothetical protein
LLFRALIAAPRLRSCTLKAAKREPVEVSFPYPDEEGAELQPSGQSNETTCTMPVHRTNHLAWCGSPSLYWPTPFPAARQRVNDPWKRSL